MLGLVYGCRRLGQVTLPSKTIAVAKESPSVEWDKEGVPEWWAFWRGWQRQGRLPEVIAVDNGPEFAGKTMDDWAYRRGTARSGTWPRGSLPRWQR